MNKGYQYRIIKKVSNGGMLITDEQKIAWVRPSALRKDSTFGKSAKIALECSYQTLADLEKSALATKSAIIPASDIISYSEKAYRVTCGTTRSWKSQFQEVPYYDFLPKSMTTVEQLPNGMVKITVPEEIAFLKRVFEKNAVL